MNKNNEGIRSLTIINILEIMIMETKIEKEIYYGLTILFANFPILILENILLNR